MQRAAAPLAGEQLAAGGAFRTLVVVVALDVVGINLDAGNGGEFGVPRDLHFPSDARRLVLVTFVVFRATMVTVGATHGLVEEVRVGSVTFTSAIQYGCYFRFLQ